MDPEFLNDENLIKMLLERHINEESLENIYKVLITYGKDLEAKLGYEELDRYIDHMKKISEKKINKIQLMLQDVIDLKNNAWIHKKTDSQINAPVKIKYENNAVKNFDTESLNNGSVWKPKRFCKNKELSQSDLFSEYILCILNKITLSTFTKFIPKIFYHLSTEEYLHTFVNLLHEKAISETKYTSLYALVCVQMKNFAVEHGIKKIFFRTLIVKKCLKQFYENKEKALDIGNWKNEMNRYTSFEQKKQIKLQNEELESVIKRKCIGNIRFIGELFNSRIFSYMQIKLCIGDLLDLQGSEMALESFCQLLIIVGKNFETDLCIIDGEELNAYFNRMQEIVDNKNYNISSRVRFMLQHVIDLKNNAWIPRIKPEKPVVLNKSNQYEKKLQNNFYFIKGVNNQNRDNYLPNKNSVSKIRFNEINISSDNAIVTNKLNQCKSKQRKKRTHYKLNVKNQSLDNTLPKENTGSEKKFDRGSQNEDEWKTVSNRSNNYSEPPTFKVDVTRLSVDIKSEEILDPSLQAMWSKVASSTKMGDIKNQRSFIDNKASLHLSSSVTNPRNYTPKVTPSSSMEKPKSYSYSANFDDNSSDKISLSGSTQNINPASRDSSLPRSAATSRNSSQTAAAPAEKLITEMIEGYAKTILEEYVNDNDLKGSNRQFEGLKLFLLENLLDDNSEKITKWIDKNVKNSRNNPDLVHALTTSVCELCYRQFQKPKSHINSDGNSEDNSEDGNDDKINKLFSKCSKYFKIYIENKGDLEMQCLIAVQEYVNKRDFPPGLHLKICKALYDLKLISFESFIQWKENPSLIDRKGVAIMQLTAFFDYISSTDQEIENQSG